jgi:hypothetical protein
MCPQSFSNYELEFEFEFKSFVLEFNLNQNSCFLSLHPTARPLDTNTSTKNSGGKS